MAPVVLPRAVAKPVPRLPAEFAIPPKTLPYAVPRELAAFDLAVEVPVPSWL
jgi:hypothetical protein